MSRSCAFLVSVYRLLPAGLTCLACLACSADPERRAQLVVFVHTNVPIVGELGEHPELSADLAIDTLRVDALDQGEVYDVHEFIAPERVDWPLSFGISANSGQSRVRLRLRAFRATRSSPEVIDSVSVEKPWRETAIDRIVDLELPTEVREVGIVLDAACVGAPANFFEPPATCIDEERPSAPPDAGILDGRGSTPAISEVAVERPCGASPSSGRVCVPGGYTVLGEPDLRGVTKVIDTLYLEPFPLRPARLPPFWMDEREFTVGRFRPLLRDGSYRGPLPTGPSNIDRYCTFIGTDDARNDDLALTCVTRSQAEEICRAIGGSLTTEARWEHAARGRGERRRFPWGEGPPRCCTASLARTTPVNQGVCSGEGPEPVASHQTDCSAGSDLSRDGLLDLGGGVSELMQDAARSFADPCWRDAGLLDPVCDDESIHDRAVRGGNWSTGLGNAMSALRTTEVFGHATGFRCMYEDAP